MGVHIDEGWNDKVILIFGSEGGGRDILEKEGLLASHFEESVLFCTKAKSV